MTPWTIAYQASLSTGFSSKNTEGVPIPFSRDPPGPGIKLRSYALQVDSLPSEPPENLGRIKHRLTALLLAKGYGERGAQSVSILPDQHFSFLERGTEIFLTCKL